MNFYEKNALNYVIKFRKNCSKSMNSTENQIQIRLKLRVQCTLGITWKNVKNVRRTVIVAMCNI